MSRLLMLTTTCITSTPTTTTGYVPVKNATKGLLPENPLEI